MSLKKSKSRFGSRVLFFFVALSLSWALSIGVGFGRDVTDADKKAYIEAMKDTEVAEQTEISTKLLAVVPRYDTLNDEMLHGSSITWESPADPENSLVLVETIVDRQDYIDYYKDHEGEVIELKMSIWVSIVPELRNYFIGKSCPPTRERIIKLKGMNPGKDYSVLVELWVDREDLFRPAPDPEITDHEGELSVKIAENDWTFPSDSNKFVTLVDDPVYVEAQWYEVDYTYKQWFMNAAQTYYHWSEEKVSDWGGPWTRLGYTYDWGDSDDHLGISEFRVFLDVTSRTQVVKVKGAVDLEIYVKRAEYFRCAREDAGGGSSGGCFVKTPQ